MSISEGLSVWGGVAGQMPKRAEPHVNAPHTQAPETQYFSELCCAMELLSQHPRSVFMGQSVQYPGTAMFNTLRNVPMEQRVELPVFEDCQLGLATGASLNGDLVVSLYPRINFLLLAMSQLVLHLDCIPRYSAYRPKVIIRTAVATDQPLNPGPQHLSDYSQALRSMLRTVNVVSLFRAEQIVPEYQKAMEVEHSTLLVEYSNQY